MRRSKSFNQSIGLNKTVVTLAVARMGDAVASSIVLIVLPLLVVHGPEAAGDAPISVRVGVLLSVFGFGFGPLAAGVLSTRFFELPFWTLGLLCVAGAAYVYFNMSETV